MLGNHLQIKGMEKDAVENVLYEKERMCEKERSVKAAIILGVYRYEGRRKVKKRE